MATIQGALGGLIFFWLGLPAPVFWGCVMAFFSLFPILGAFVVWLPVALTFVVQGEWLGALLLAGWGLVVIHPVDNLLGPVLGKHAEIAHSSHFFAIIGGLAAFGASGVVLGPLSVAVGAERFEIKKNPLPQS